MKKLLELEESENAVYELISTLTQQFPKGFPGLSDLGYKPANEMERAAITFGCRCGEARLNGEILDHLEGILVGMHMVGSIDAIKLRNHFFRTYR